jgi:hypothetical protein
MKGIIRKIDLVERKKKNGGTFKQIVFTVDVVVDEDKKTIKTRSAYLNEDYAKKYANYVGKSSAEMIGSQVQVVLEKRMYEKDGVEKISETIKYLNFLDKEGQPIIMPKEDAKELGF